MALAPIHLFKQFHIPYRRLQAGEGICLLVSPGCPYSDIFSQEPLARWTTERLTFKAIMRKHGSVVIWLFTNRDSIVINFSSSDYYHQESDKPPLFPLHLLSPSPIL